MPTIPAPHWSIWISVSGQRVKVETNPEGISLEEVITTLRQVADNLQQGEVQDPSSQERPLT